LKKGNNAVERGRENKSDDSFPEAGGFDHLHGKFENLFPEEGVPEGSK